MDEVDNCAIKKPLISTEEIRTNLRKELKNKRIVNKNLETDQHRIGLVEINKLFKYLDSLNEKDVAGMCSRIKRRKHADKDDLFRLSNAFLKSEENIIEFVKTPGALQVLVKELTGSDSEQQIRASETFCNLSLGDNVVCEKLVSIAGSYYITYLSSTDKRLRRTCLWILQNILVSKSKKAIEALISMEVVSKLLNIYLLNYFDDDDEFVLDSAVALDLLFSTKIVEKLVISENNLAKLFLKSPNGVGAEFHLKLLFDLNLTNSSLEHEQLKYLANFSILNIKQCCDLKDYNSELRFLYSIRVLANLLVENVDFYQVFTEMLENLTDFLNNIFGSKKFYDESLWFLKNFLKCYELKGGDINYFLKELKIKK